MTVIVGLEHNGKAYIGCDSAASSEDFIGSIDRAKLIRKKNIVIGYCSSFRVGQIIENNFNFSKVKKTEKWIYVGFINELRRVFTKNGASIFAQGEQIANQSEIMVAHNKKIYIVQDDFSILRYKRGYCAIGHGASYAHGALYATPDIDDPYKRINLALEAAADFDPSVAAPFYIYEL